MFKKNLTIRHIIWRFVVKKLKLLLCYNITFCGLSRNFKLFKALQAFNSKLSVLLACDVTTLTSRENLPVRDESHLINLAHFSSISGLYISTCVPLH